MCPRYARWELLLFNLDLLLQNPGLFLRLTAVMVLALVAAITVHEASHALIATMQGDNTARALRRLSLNPLRHMDPAGTAMLFLVGFGWGKPVPVNPMRLKNGPRVGTALVALAGPASNLLLAVLIALPVRLGLAAWHNPRNPSGEPFAYTNWEWIVADIIGFAVLYNLILAVFNLIPIAPLDGFKVALGVLPRHMAISFARLEPYGPGILMAVIMLSYIPMFGFSLWDVLGPVVRGLSLLVVGRPI